MSEYRIYPCRIPPFFQKGIIIGHENIGFFSKNSARGIHDSDETGGIQDSEKYGSKKMDMSYEHYIVIKKRNCFCTEKPNIAPT